MTMLRWKEISTAEYAVGEGSVVVVVVVDRTSVATAPEHPHAARTASAATRTGECVIFTVGAALHTRAGIREGARG